MDSADLQVLQAVAGWHQSGLPFSLVTVARTWGSAPRPAGSWLALAADGRVAGSVSGGCIEDDLIRRMAEGRLAGPAPFTLGYGVTREEAARFGLPCGGTLELVVEPAPDPARLAELALRIGAGQLVRREVDLAAGTVSLTDARRGDALSWDGQRLATIHGPRWRLLIIGANQLAQTLAPMAMALDYAVTVCDPRIEYTSQWNVPGTRLTTEMPDDAVLALPPDPHTAIVALTHDPKLDDLALLEALKSPVFYVGALGSQRSNAARRARLLEHFDLTAEEIGRLHGPVGLAIGSRTPAEIAVSILAQMTAVKRGAALAQTRQTPEPLAAPIRGGCAA
ncbi:MAG: XdhC family protein [Rhodocyclaceae bacterium]|jgi:xanthine dehydrogenase accessory factor|nr:XdhC family protein [Rhodocyclaceae bacterium]